jgi:signal transduction histidine kinase
MKSGADSLAKPRKILELLREKPRLIPTGVIFVAVHIIAFVALSLATLVIVQREIIRAHSDSARLFAGEVVQDLHPVMVSARPAEIRVGMEDFVKAHDLLDLQLYDASGRPLTGAPPGDPHVAQLLSEGARDRFDLEETDEGWALHGLVPIVSRGLCDDCHRTGDVVGVAALSYDLTPYLGSARGRLRRILGVLMMGWLTVLGVVTFSTKKLVDRSMARVRANLGNPEPEGQGETRSVSSLVLDPLSAELLASVREVVDRQKRREEKVASRLHHTERLASLGQLSASLAHEIKNPIASIQGVLEILRDEATDEASRTLFERTIAETRRVNATIQDLLQFARPGQPKKAVIDVAELLEDTVQLLAAGFARRNISVEVSTAPDLPQCLIDPAQIRQVLVNLVNNAGEAIESGGRIRVRCTGFPEGSGVIIAVEDDGPGIPLERQEQIFGPFYTTKVHGTGLGLAVARTLVEEHGGTLEVDSRPGEGSTFLIVLPSDGRTENDSSVGKG